MNSYSDRREARCRTDAWKRARQSTIEKSENRAVKAKDAQGGMRQGDQRRWQQMTGKDVRRRKASMGKMNGWATGRGDRKKLTWAGEDKPRKGRAARGSKSGRSSRKEQTRGGQKLRQRQ